MTRQANKREIAWCNRLQRLMDRMPHKMALVADGKLNAVDAKELKNYDTLEQFSPLQGTGDLGKCDGGDPWK